MGSADLILHIVREFTQYLPHHHNVYVVKLSKDVLSEPRFKKCNPAYELGKPCVYVGMTGLSPDERLDKHEAGIKSNKFMRLYELRLLPASENFPSAQEQRNSPHQLVK